MMQQLPIDSLREKIVDSLRRENRLILKMPPGTGKSTRLPQFLADDLPEFPGKILVLEPRRLAARLLARRVAWERNGTMGGEVGYRIRFDTCAGPETRIEFLTEGILLRRLANGDSLEGVAAVVFDEFHERNLYTDLSLAGVLRLQREQRPALRVVVMSATLEADKLAKYLAPAPVVEGQGEVHPVEKRYLKHSPSRGEPVWETAADAAERLPDDGDVLIFMPGKYEIDRTLRALQERNRSWAVFGLHGGLSSADQDAVLQPGRGRRVVVATNVAETSITVEGVRHVIDSGLARVARHDPRRGMEMLLVERISQASADQRAGRAGRTAPGICIRLWTELEQGRLPSHDTPEIHRVDLAETVLLLKQMGVGDPDEFPWFEPPRPEQLAAAVEMLTDLGAIETDNGGITPLGSQMARFPLPPRYSRLLLAAEKRGWVEAAAWVAALMQARPLFRGQKNRREAELREDLLGETPESDFLQLHRAFQFAEAKRFDPRACGKLGIDAGAARQIRAQQDQLLELARRMGLKAEKRNPSPGDLQRILLEGFSDRLARRIDGGTLRCQVVHGRRGVLDRNSQVRKSPLLVAAEITEVEGREREVRLGMATAVEEEWLAEDFPAEFREERVTRLDAQAKRVVQTSRRWFRDLLLEEKAGGEPDLDQAAGLLAEEVLAGNCPLKAWDDAVRQWIARLNFAARSCPEQEFPAIGAEEEELLLQQICRGATSFREVRDRPVWPVLRQWLSAGQNDLLDRWFPERLALPSGRKARLRYSDQGPPVLSARIQELFDLRSTPALAGGRVSLVLEILAPNHRPVQVTSDLAGFWRETYPTLKSELSRRYPKHEWR